MKFNFGKRLVLFLHLLLSLLICALLVAVCISPQIVAEIASLINSLVGASVAEIVGIVALVIYALLAAMALMTIFGGRGKRSERGFITVDSSESGRTRIAVGAVDQMIRQAVRSVEGITEMKASIINNQDAIAISCNVGITSGVHVPTVTMNIQRAIRSYIEFNCGVAVSEVSVSVHSMEDAESGRGRKKGKIVPPAPAAAVPVYAPVQESAVQLAPEKETAVVSETMEEEAALPEPDPISLTLEVPEEITKEASAEKEEASPADEEAPAETEE